MPKYRFRWEAVPADVLTALAVAADCPGTNPCEGLRRQYGARPKEDFVRDLWPTLRDDWLGSDDAAMLRVEEALRSAGLGRNEKPTSIEFLRSVRNSKTLRAIVLSEFRDLGDSKGRVESTSGKLSEAKKEASNSPPKIGRPRRKQVQFNSLQQSPEGGQFINNLVALVGEPNVVPLGKVRDTHVFAAFGGQGRALIAEQQEQQTEADQWRSLTAFRTDSSDAVEISIEMVRWDEWLAFDADEVRKAPRSQRKAWDDRRVELAGDSDTLTIVQRPQSMRDEPLLDLSSAEVRACWQLLRELAPEHEPASSEPVTVEEATAEQVGSRVLELLRSTTGNEQLVPDTDGDIPLQFGSSMVFVRVFGDPPIVRVYSPVVEKVTSAAVATTVVNDLNQDSAFTKWLAVNDSIIAVMDLFGRPLNETHIIGACSMVGSSADSLDEELQAKLGGKTFFGEIGRPSLPTPRAGYL